MRPKGLGLGADRSLMLQTEKDKKNGSIEDEENVMKRGCHCIIVVGRHNGFYGTVSKFNTAHIFKGTSPGLKSSKNR